MLLEGLRRGLEDVLHHKSLDLLLAFEVCVGHAVLDELPLSQCPQAFDGIQVARVRGVEDQNLAAGLGLPSDDVGVVDFEVVQEHECLCPAHLLPQQLQELQKGVSADRLLPSEQCNHLTAQVYCSDDSDRPEPQLLLVNHQAFFACTRPVARLQLVVREDGLVNEDNILASLYHPDNFGQDRALAVLLGRQLARSEALVKFERAQLNLVQPVNLPKLADRKLPPGEADSE